MSLLKREEGAVRPYFPFKWASGSITYLETKVPKDTSKVFALNFPPTLASLKLELKHWDMGNLSWFGCCNAVKMVSFPRLLYLSQTLPIKIPAPFLWEVNRTFAVFIWK